MTKHRRRESRSETWKQLSVRDVEEILEEVELDVSQEVKSELRQHINADLSYIGGWRDMRRKSTPSRKISEYKKIHDAAARLLVAFRGCEDAKLTLAYEWDKLAKSPASSSAASIEELRAAFPDSCEEEILLGHCLGAVVPTQEAKESIEFALLSVEVIKKLAKNAELVEQENQARLGGKERPRKPDDLRHAFVARLAMIYRKLLHMETKTTEDKPWVIFLAAVLSRCERKAITAAGAKDLWLAVRKKMAS